LKNIQIDGEKERKQFCCCYQTYFCLNGHISRFGNEMPKTVETPHGVSTIFQIHPIPWWNLDYIITPYRQIV